MSFCPDCKNEYPDNFYECPFCTADAVADDPILVDCILYGFFFGLMF